VLEDPSTLTLRISVADMSEMTLRALGINGAEPVRVTVRSNLTFEVQQGKHGRGGRHSKLSLQLNKVVAKFLDAHAKEQCANLPLELYERVAQRVRRLGDYCMLCDSKLPMPGLKPIACDGPLCTYQMEQLGIGANLDELRSNPTVSDLLISMAYAAATSWRTELTMPRVPVDLQNASAVSKILQDVPSISALDTQPLRQKRLLNASHTSAARAVQWVLSSNRAHLVALEPEACFASMETPYQFRIQTGTRSHEASFNKLKAQHGTFYAFHGSPFTNWHNLLRTNLKVASGTALQLNGARYGNGIYMGEDTSHSDPYATPGRPWPGSIFGTGVRCLALCEVVNSPSIQRYNGFLVAPDENTVALRYLFIYGQDGTIPRVAADSLGIRPYRNEVCIASQEPIDTVPEGQLLVTSDNYAWDIEELVAMIKADGGRFRNGFSTRMFAAEDVQAIIYHASGEGLLLRDLERANEALRGKISQETLAQIAIAGAVCKGDNSIDFAPSQQALGHLHAHLAGLSDDERDALDRAPFQCTDSRTLQPYRNTVSNALREAGSEGACIHLTGDFLTQVGAFTPTASGEPSNAF
jgi:hypothetical protein